MILSKREQIFLVKSDHIAFWVLIDNMIRYDNGSTFISCVNVVEREASWKTGD